MPKAQKFRNLTLPTVTVKGDVEEIAALVRRDKLSPETLLELGVWLRRQAAELDALKEMTEAVTEKIGEYYEARKPDARATVRTSAGFVTYRSEGEKPVIKDRDDLVGQLTDEQIRASYVPDIKALETILPKKMFERLTDKQKTKASVTIKDTGGDFEALDD